MKPARVIIGVPYTEQTDSGVVHNWLKIKPQPEDWIEQTGSYLPEAHNRVFQKALENPNLERLLLLENDMKVDPGIVARVRTHKADIVTGLYFGRRNPHMPMLWKDVTPDGIGINADHLFMAELADREGHEVPIGACGTGILSVARHVIELMAFPWFEPSPADVSEGRFGGHDLYFCAKARAQGFTICADVCTQMVAKHVGKIDITIEHYLAVMKGQADAEHARTNGSQSRETNPLGIASRDYRRIPSSGL